MKSCVITHRTNPDPLGAQHDEREPGWFGGRFKWSEGLREIQDEAILHPLIREAARTEVAAWTSPYGLLVVPLLLERTGSSRVDRVLVVDCPEDEQIRRVGLRSGIAPAEVRAIMATQLPRAERLGRADDILDNAGPHQAIAHQVALLQLQT